MEANWQDFTLLDWSFDCIRMGASGFAVIAPEEGGGLPSSSVDSEEQTDEDYDDSARNVNVNSKSNFSVEQNRKTFATSETMSNITKGTSTIAVGEKSPVRNRIYVPVHAEITPNGDIKFTFEKL